MTGIAARTGAMTEAAAARFAAGRAFLARHRSPAGKAGLADAAGQARDLVAGMGIRRGQILWRCTAPMA